MKVICISGRVNMPGQIVVGRQYYIGRESIWLDSDGDAYGQVYNDNKQTECIGQLKLSHFASI